MRCGRRFRYRNGRARRADAELWPARRDCVRNENHRSEDGFALRRFRRRSGKSRSRRWRDCSRLLHDNDGHVAIEGFYDTVKPLEDWEREAWQQIADRWRQGNPSGNRCRPSSSAKKVTATFERIWARPTAEINGIGGGYQGQGTKTVIASDAMAKLTFRLVPNQDGEKF